MTLISIFKIVYFSLNIFRSRRGTARNFLGRHRAALRDFEKAMSFEPTNKKLHTEVRKTREAIKACVKRTPRQRVVIRELAAPVGPGFFGAPGAKKGKQEKQTNVGPTFTTEKEVSFSS